MNHGLEVTFAPDTFFMAELYNPLQIEKAIALLNGKFNCAVHASEFNDKSYSKSSLSDLLVQRYSDELSGEWTTEKAFAGLKSGLLKLGISEASITNEALLETLIPLENRRERVKEWSLASGMELDVLKPNGIVNGALIFLFFAFIPLGIGMDWFISGIGMLLCAGGIFLLGKTARKFKMETIGQMAESIAWKLYLQQQKTNGSHSTMSIQTEVNQILERV
jgi:hypothetical protein